MRVRFLVCEAKCLDEGIIGGKHGLPKEIDQAKFVALVLRNACIVCVRVRSAGQTTQCIYNTHNAGFTASFHTEQRNKQAPGSFSYSFFIPVIIGESKNPFSGTSSIDPNRSSFS